MSEKSRVSAPKTHIEFLRILACFCVIVNHTNSPIFQAGPDTAIGVVSLTYFFMSKVAVPVFLFIMGALLLGRQDSYKKCSKRAGRILAVIVLFSAIYYVYQHYRGLRGLHPAEFVSLLIAKHMTVAHWYLYAYLGLLCVLPLMQKMSLSFDKRDVQLLLVLSLGFNGVVHLLSVFWGIQVSGHIGASFISKNIALVFAGYYLEKYCRVGRKGFLCACAGFVGMVAFQVFATLKLYRRDPAYYLQLDDYSAILIVACAACVYCMAKYLFAERTVRQDVCRWIQKIGGLTFGIYLVADMVIEVTRPVFTWMSGRMNPMPAVILWEMMIFAIGAAITLAMKKIPVLRKLL